MSSPRPIILVTGANSGLGFATCQRMLLQLSDPTPSDTLPYSPGKRPDGQEPLATPYPAHSGCTLIMACRNPIKAHKARRALVDLVDRIKHLPDHIPTPTSASALQKLAVGPPVSAKSTLLKHEPDEILAQGQQEETVALNAQAQRHPQSTTTATHRRKQPQSTAAGRDDAAAEEDEEPLSVSLQDDVAARDAKARGKYRRRFCRGTKIEFVALDLGSMGSVLTCAQQLQDRYPYLTHLIHNAGGAAFTGINWPLAVFMILTAPIAAVTYPRFKLQRSGDLSQDGLGWVWQVNVGSSWALTQALLPLMRKSPYSSPPRVIFTSSVEAHENFYKPDDYQCLSTDSNVSKPYESTKYQCDLAAHALVHQLQQEDYKHPNNPEVYLTHPGVVATSIMADQLNVVTSFLMLTVFFFARWALSIHHCIEPYKGAIAHVHTSLAPSEKLRPHVRYHSCSDFWGREYVGASRTDGWDTQDERGHDVTSQGHVTTLALDWAKKTNGVIRRIRRASDAGLLPPSVSELRKEAATMSSADVSSVEDSDGDDGEVGGGKGRGGRVSALQESQEWEKVEQAV